MHYACILLSLQASDEAVQRVLLVDVVNLLALDGIYADQVRHVLDSSEVWAAYKGQRHDLFLPAGGSSADGVVGLLRGPEAARFALPAPVQAPAAHPDVIPVAKQQGFPPGPVSEVPSAPSQDQAYHVSKGILNAQVKLEDPAGGKGAVPAEEEEEEAASVDEQVRAIPTEMGRDSIEPAEQGVGIAPSQQDETRYPSGSVSGRRAVQSAQTSSNQKDVMNNNNNGSIVGDLQENATMSVASAKSEQEATTPRHVEPPPVPAAPPAGDVGGGNRSKEERGKDPTAAPSPASSSSAGGGGDPSPYSSSSSKMGSLSPGPTSAATRQEALSPTKAYHDPLSALGDHPQ